MKMEMKGGRVNVFEGLANRLHVRFRSSRPNRGGSWRAP